MKQKRNENTVVVLPGQITLEEIIKESAGEDNNG